MKFFGAFQERDRKLPQSVGGLPVYLTWSRSDFTDFELLRMPLAKFEIAKDNEVERPLPPIATGTRF